VAGAGRPPKPNAIKRATGNPGKRALPRVEDEPTPPPPPPGGIMPTGGAATWPAGGHADQAWHRMVAILEPMGLLDTGGVDALVLLCEAYAEYWDARADVIANGLTFEKTTDRGGTSVQANPAVAMAANAWGRVYTGLSQFGLTPSARAKLGGKRGEEADPFEQFDGPTIAGGKRAS
jgi:P27 family predicted phage terminase small subunit